MFVATVCRCWAQNYGTYPHYKCDDIDDDFRIDPPKVPNHTLSSEVTTISRIREVVDLRKSGFNSLFGFLADVFLHHVRRDDVDTCNFMFIVASDAIHTPCNVRRAVNTAIVSGSLIVLKELVENHNFSLTVRSSASVGLAHHSVARSIMVWLLSKKMDLTGAYLEAIQSNSLENLQILKDLGVRCPHHLWF